MPEALVVTRRSRWWAGVIVGVAAVVALAVGAIGGGHGGSMRTASSPSSTPSAPPPSPPPRVPVQPPSDDYLQAHVFHDARGRLADPDPFRECRPDRLIEVPFELVDDAMHPTGMVVKVWFGCAPPGTKTFLRPGAVYALRVPGFGHEAQMVSAEPVSPS
jgi:hypothetical protein